MGLVLGVGSVNDDVKEQPYDVLVSNFPFLLHPYLSSPQFSYEEDFRGDLSLNFSTYTLYLIFAIILACLPHLLVSTLICSSQMLANATR